MTSYGKTWNDCDVYVATAATPTTSDFWKISDVASSITVSGGERGTNGSYTFGNDAEQVLAGKRARYQITVNAVYAEGTTQTSPNGLFLAMHNAFKNQYPVSIKWYPLGNTTGNFEFYTTPGVLKSSPLPGGNATDSPIVLTIAIECEDYTKTTAT